MTEREIFIAAFEQPDRNARLAFLDRACADDSGMRARIDALLRNADGAGNFLERPAAADYDAVTPAQADSPTATAPTAKTTPVDAINTQIGPYRLSQVIGEGGMGTVYLAEQEEPIRRQVALKIMKAGMDSGQFAKRFDAERQALARMNHPNIAKVLDAGTTSAGDGDVKIGRPYFVMELVDGVPLTGFCNEQRLSLRDRLK